MTDHDPHEPSTGSAPSRGWSRSTVLLVAGSLALVGAHGLRWLLCGPGVGDDGSYAFTGDAFLLAAADSGYGRAGLLAAVLAVLGAVLLLVGAVAKGVSLGVREARETGD